MLGTRYKEGRLLRRWSLIGGHPVCVMDALDTATARAAEVAAIEAENARIEAVLSTITAYETALLLAAEPEPPPTEAGVSTDGTAIQLPNPHHVEWASARETIAAASPATLALAARRAAIAPAPRLMAVIDPDGRVVLIQAVDPDWQPIAPLIAVDLGPDAQIGGTFADRVFTLAPPSPPPVPASVSRFQARAALAMAGLLPAVDAAIAASGSVIAQIAWADAQVFERGSPTIAGLASAIGLTDAQIDNLFRTAAEIVA